MAPARGRPIRNAVRRAKSTSQPSAPLKEAPKPKPRKPLVRDLNQWAAQRAIVRRMGILPKDVIIVDGGARRGNVTNKYLELFPKAHVHSFEPEPVGFRETAERFCTDSRVTIVRKALYSCEDEEAFYVGGQRGEMSSLLPRAKGKKRYYRHDLERLPELVPTISLDEYFKRKPGPHIIKLDLQGGERAALAGARALFRRKQPPLMVYTEVLFVELYEGNPLLYDIWGDMLKHKYVLFDLYDFARSKVNRRLKVADALFVSPAVQKMLEAMPEEWLAKSLPLRLERG